VKGECLEGSAGGGGAKKNTEGWSVLHVNEDSIMKPTNTVWEGEEENGPNGNIKEGVSLLNTVWVYEITQWTPLLFITVC
jgi:hypothetical protein